jgi:hypothetical protein
MANNELVKYIIDDYALEEEAWHQFDSQYEDEALTEDEWKTMIAQMIEDASTPCKAYSKRMTNFAAWVWNRPCGDAIGDAIHDAIWEYVHEYISNYTATKED